MLKFAHEVLLEPIDDHTGADALARNLSASRVEFHSGAPYAYGGHEVA
jgi:hypothetical protein